MHSVTRTIFLVFAFKVAEINTVKLGLLIRVAILSGGHVPQVPQWHDASARDCLRPDSAIFEIEKLIIA